MQADPQPEVAALREEIAQLERKTEALRSADTGAASLRVGGQGDRQYLTGLKLGGARVLILVDASASMLDETIVEVIRRRDAFDRDRVYTMEQALSEAREIGYTGVERGRRIGRCRRAVACPAVRRRALAPAGRTPRRRAVTPAAAPAASGGAPKTVEEIEATRRAYGIALRVLGWAGETADVAIPREVEPVLVVLLLVARFA